MNEKKNTYEYTGSVHSIGMTKTFPSGFAIRELVCVDDPNQQYKNYPVFQFVKSKNEDLTAKLAGFHQGDTVRICFYLSGNESKKNPGSYFGSARATSIERVGAVETNYSNNDSAAFADQEPKDGDLMPF